MSGDGHIPEAVPTSIIAEMPPYYFWTLARSIGLTPETAQVAVDNGGESAARVLAKSQEAMTALLNAPVPGVQSWMSPQRIRC